MPEQPKTEQEKKSLKLEVLEKVSTLATAGLGLVAALAWNDAIQTLFRAWFPTPGDSIAAKLLYALLITILIVVVTIQLGRTVNVAKKQLNHSQKK
jgi:hypothetical protein